VIPLPVSSPSESSESKSGNSACKSRGENVRHNVGCRTRNLDAIFATWR
jgi:hypothetical protein